MFLGDVEWQTSHSESEVTQREVCRIVGQKSPSLTELALQFVALANDCVNTQLAGWTNGYPNE